MVIYKGAGFFLLLSPEGAGDSSALEDLIAILAIVNVPVTGMEDPTTTTVLSSGKPLTVKDDG